MSNTVRAKVLCTQITVDPDFGHSSLYFSAGCSNDPESENAAFTDATPHLTLAMTIASGKPAAQLFEQGQEYYLDFTRVAAVVDPRQTSIEDSSPLVRSAVVYGPQGCGKTTNAQALTQHLNLETVIDGWNGLTAFPTFGALVLTDLSRSQLVRLLADRRAQIIDFYDVMRSAKLSAPCMPAVVDPQDGGSADCSASGSGGGSSGD